MSMTTPEQKVYKTKKFGWEYVDVVLKSSNDNQLLVWKSLKKWNLI